MGRSKKEPKFAVDDAAAEEEEEEEGEGEEGEDTFSCTHSLDSRGENGGGKELDFAELTKARTRRR